MVKTSAYLVAACVALCVGKATGHGQLTWPPSTRHHGSLLHGNECTQSGACYWFTSNVEIPSAPTLALEARSIQADVTGGVQDVYKTYPWRAPGSAPVLGSGCSVAGGGPVAYANGGTAPPWPGVQQGVDALDVLPPFGAPAVWTKGAQAEVAFSMAANHNGGYAYRLCKKGGEVSEACFQAGHLKFAADSHWAVYPNGTKVPLPMTKVTEGTTPEGSEWVRNPIPGCYVCDAYASCGAPLPLPPAEIGTEYDTDWNQQQNCFARCDGAGLRTECDEVPLQFPSDAPAYSGFGKGGWDWSVMDRLQVPADIEAGEYLLSWRWDCEQSGQVWQNCADIVIVEDEDEAAAAAAAGETFALITPAAIKAAPVPDMPAGGAGKDYTSYDAEYEMKMFEEQCNKYKSDGRHLLQSMGDTKADDKSAYDKSAYDKSAYDKSGYDKSAYDKSAYDKSAYDKSGYDKSAYDKSASDMTGNEPAAMDTGAKAGDQWAQDYLADKDTGKGTSTSDKGMKKNGKDMNAILAKCSELFDIDFSAPAPATDEVLSKAADEDTGSTAADEAATEAADEELLGSTGGPPSGVTALRAALALPLLAAALW